MFTKHKISFFITLFNGITALAGGMGLVFKIIKPPIEWLSNSPFNSYLVPGLILGVFVGGASLLAAAELYKKSVNQYKFSAIAGLIMLGWITGELIFIQRLSPFQLLYIITGFIATSPAYYALKIKQENLFSRLNNT